MTTGTGQEAPVTGDAARTFAHYLDATRDEPVYVILGVQGSGTNLLRRVLVGAFGFSVLQDRSMIYGAGIRLGDRPSVAAVQKEFDWVLSRIFPTALVRKTRKVIRRNEAFAGLAAAFDPQRIRSGADFIRFIYAYRASAEGTRLMAIKSDDLWEHIADIDRLIPRRRILLLTRDFRDNFLSISAKDFGPIDPLCAAGYVKTRFAHYDAEYKRTSATERYHLRYEDLLDSPRQFVADFSARFGIPLAAGADRALTELRIKPHRVGKWTRLPRPQLALCEAVLREELLSYGYTPECAAVAGPGPADWLLASARDTVRRIPQKVGRVVRRLRS